MAATLLAGLGLGVAPAAQAKPFMDYLKPMPPVAPLSDATWGVAGVIPRDISNGIESAKGKGTTVLIALPQIRMVNGKGDEA